MLREWQRDPLKGDVVHADFVRVKRVLARHAAVEGDPATVITETAQETGADLIVMGAKGLAAIDRFLLGSVSTRVVQHADCAVLVVR